MYFNDMSSHHGLVLQASKAFNLITKSAFLIACLLSAGHAAAQNISSYAGGPDNDNLPAHEMSMQPYAVVVDKAGNILIADGGFAHRLLKLDTATGIITIMAGNGSPGFNGDGGQAKSAQLDSPCGLAVDKDNNIFLADYFNNRIRKIDQKTGVITTVVGSGSWGRGGDGGLAINASMHAPQAIAFHPNGDLYISDTGNHKIRKVDAVTGIITTVAGTGNEGYSGDGGLAINATLDEPMGLAFRRNGDLVFCDMNNMIVRSINLGTGVITKLAGVPLDDIGEHGDGGPATNAKLRYPSGLAVDKEDNIFIVDRSHHTVRMISAADGMITRFAGETPGGYNGKRGIANQTKLYYPESVAIDALGNVLIADQYNHFIRKVDRVTLTTDVIAGNGSPRYNSKEGAAATAHFWSIWGLTSDKRGNLYVSDLSNHQIYRIDTGTGTISVAAGLGIAAVHVGYWIGDAGGLAHLTPIKTPLGIAADEDGNLYFADKDTHLVRKVDVHTKRLSDVAGVGIAGYDNDTKATEAMLNTPTDVELDNKGNIFISEYGNSRVRKVNLATGTISTVAGNRTVGFDGDGGLAVNAKLSRPWGIALDSEGNLFINDSGNNRIRKVDATTGIISTFAGNGVAGYSGDGGPALDASLSVNGLFVDAANHVYIVDEKANRIRMINSAGIISTIAGNGAKGYGGDGGPATAAILSQPRGITIDQAGNIFIGDYGNGRIRQIGSNRLSQSITFPAIGSKVYGDEPFALEAKSSVSLPITYSSSDPSIATVKDGIVTITGVGTVIITASQPGSSAYNAADPVQRNLTVLKGSQSITFHQAEVLQYSSNPFYLSGVASSWLPVTYTSSNESVAIVEGDLLIIKDLGTTTLTATQPGNNFYHAAEPVSLTVNVVKADQAIDFYILSDRPLSDVSFHLFANATSGLPVTFKSSDPSVATVRGNMVILLEEGTTTITAFQDGDHYYHAAAPVEREFTVTAPNSIPLQLIWTSPFAGEEQVDPETTITLSYNRNVMLMSGTITYYDMTSNSIFRRDVVDETNATVFDNEVTITPADVFPAGANIGVELDPWMIVDLDGNPAWYVPSVPSWNFITQANITGIESSSEEALSIEVTGAVVSIKPSSASVKLISVTDVLGRTINPRVSYDGWQLPKPDGVILVRYQISEEQRTARIVIVN